MDFNSFFTNQKAIIEQELFACCSSNIWTEGVLNAAPFSTEKELLHKATDIWYFDCKQSDWLEAFSHHPEIGDIKSLQQKFAGKEQAGISEATQLTIEALSAANTAYKNKFGFIFIVCATGKSANQMLRLLQDRLNNSPSEELHIAMGEQMKITCIRLMKLFHQSDWSFLKVSQLTTHVLDTSTGVPAKDMSIRLQRKHNGIWQTFTQGITNTDGRIADLLPQEFLLPEDHYKLIFDTGNYFKSMNIQGFYPEVEIQFRVSDQSHYHVPLLINPFGYSTYRGS